MSAEWQQLTIRSAKPEAVAEVLEACGALAVTLKDAEDTPVLEPAPGQTPLWPQTLVVGLFDGADSRDGIETRLQVGAGDWIRSTHWDDLPEQIWERAWLEHFRPMNFGRRLRIAPHEADVPQDDRITLRLDPGLAFGTGTHPSTALCLHWLGDQDLRGKSVIDFGCGSGVLGIAAGLLGASSIHACDIDPQAEIATQENARANGQEVSVCACDAMDGQQFDIVLANILAGTLISLAPQLTAMTQPGGFILLAGLLTEQAAAVESAFPAFDFQRFSQGEWTMLRGRHNFCD